MGHFLNSDTNLFILQRNPYPLKMLGMGRHCIWLKDSKIRRRLLVQGLLRQLVQIVAEV